MAKTPAKKDTLRDGAVHPGLMKHVHRSMEKNRKLLRLLAKEGHAAREDR